LAEIATSSTESIKPDRSIFLGRSSFHVTSLPSKGFLTGNIDGTINYWSYDRELDSRAPFAISAPDQQGARSLDFRPDGAKLAVGGWWMSEVILLYDIATRTTQSIHVKGVRDSYGALRFRPNSGLLFVQTDDDLRVFDTDKTGDPEMEPLNLGAKSTDFTFDATGDRMAVSFEDGVIKLYDLSIARQEDVLYSGKPDAGCRLAISSDGKLLAAYHSSHNCRLDLFDVKNRRLSRSIEIYGQGEEIGGGVAIHPNGKIVATGGEDGEISLWNVDSGKRVGVLSGHAFGSIKSLEFSSDGRRVLSGGLDRTMRLWDWEMERELLVFEQHLYVLCARFSPDGLWIANTDYHPTGAWLRRAMTWKTDGATFSHADN
jgi:WD40 repeat protein